MTSSHATTSRVSFISRERHIDVQFIHGHTSSIFLNVVIRNKKTKRQSYPKSHKRFRCQKMRLLYKTRNKGGDENCQQRIKFPFGKNFFGNKVNVQKRQC